MTHFFIAIDFYGWAQGTSVEDAIEKREEDSGAKLNMNVWKIIGDPKMLYSICWFTPQIEGAQWVWARFQDSDDNWIIEADIENEYVEVNPKGRYSLAK